MGVSLLLIYFQFLIQKDREKQVAMVEKFKRENTNE